MIGFVSTLNDDSVAYRCLSLIERHAARLMKSGGGSLPQDNPLYHRPITNAERQQMRKMLHAGHTIKEICVELNRSQHAVQSNLHAMGEKTPRQLRLAKERAVIERQLRAGKSIRETARATRARYVRVWQISRQLTAA